MFSQCSRTSLSSVVPVTLWTAYGRVTFLFSCCAGTGLGVWTILRYASFKQKVHYTLAHPQPYSIYKYTANIPRTARAAAFLEAPFL